MQASKQKRDQRSPPSSPDSDGSFDKSQLMAKLDEMSKAIDGYKELKSKGSQKQQVQIQSSNQSRNAGQLEEASQNSMLESKQSSKASVIVKEVCKDTQIDHSFSNEGIKVEQRQSVLSITTEGSNKREIEYQPPVVLKPVEIVSQVPLQQKTPIKVPLLPKTQPTLMPYLQESSISQDEGELSKQSLMMQVEQPNQTKVRPGNLNLPLNSDRDKDLRALSTSDDPVSFNQTLTINGFNTMTYGGDFRHYLDQQQNSPKFFGSMSSKAFLFDMMNPGNRIPQFSEVISQEIQCDLDYQEQTEFIEKHKYQLQSFEESLVLLKEQLVLQQENEYDLRQQMDSMQNEILKLRKEKQENLDKEEDLLRQVDSLVGVVDEQTQELRVRDRQIRDLQTVESEFTKLQSDVNLLIQQQEQQQSEKDKVEKEKNELQKQVAEFQEKFSNEFQKKRKMMQEYDQQVIELQDEADYFKDKYDELKELLSNCTEQLKQFEELNVLRNDVIEKLERDNQHFRDLLTLTQQQHQIVFNHLQPQSLSPQQMTVHTESSNGYLQNTPCKSDKSFSLNLQQVNCERSRHVSRDLSQISEKGESQCTNTERNSREIYSYQERYLTEKKQEQYYLRRELDVVPTPERDSEQDEESYYQQQQSDRYVPQNQQRQQLQQHQQQQQQQQVVYYSQSSTPKSSNHHFDIPNQDILSSSSKRDNRLTEYLIEENEPEIQDINRISDYRQNLRELNHSISEQRLHDPQIEDSVSGLNPGASISQYERVYQTKRHHKGKNRNSIHYVPMNNFLSPHQRDDPYKLSFGDMQQIMSPSLNTNSNTNVSSITTINPPEYCQSESKYQYGRYQRDNKLIQHSQFNKENSYVLERHQSNITSARHSQIVQEGTSDHPSADFTYTNDGHSLISNNLNPSRQNRPFRIIEQNVGGLNHSSGNMNGNSAQQLEMVLAQGKEDHSLLHHSSKGKKPFDYMINNPIYHSHQQQETPAEPQKGRGIQGYQTSCTFAKNGTNESMNTEQDKSYSQDDSHEYSDSSHRERRESSNKSSSIRDEIKKLHNNINSLRQKMNIPPKLQNQKYTSEKTQMNSSNTSAINYVDSPKGKGGAQQHFQILKESLQ